jgi:hypothetical protein
VEELFNKFSPTKTLRTAGSIDANPAENTIKVKNVDPIWWSEPLVAEKGK